MIEKMVLKADQLQTHKKYDGNVKVITYYLFNIHTYN